MVGKHEATVVQCSVGQSTKKGTWYVKVLFRFTPPNANVTEIYGFIWLSEKAMNIARKSLKAIGFDVDKQELSEIQNDPLLLTGKKAEIEIEEQQNEFRVKWINPLQSTPIPAMFNDLLRKAKTRDEEVEESKPKAPEPKKGNPLG